MAAATVRSRFVRLPPFYIDAEQCERWNRPQILLDAAPGSAEGFLARRARGNPLRHALARLLAVAAVGRAKPCRACKPAGRSGRPLRAD